MPAEDFQTECRGKSVNISGTVGVGVEYRDLGLLESGDQSRLDPGLAGTWYWEADPLYVPGNDLLTKSASTLTIDREGGFTLYEAGVCAYRGRFVQQGNRLIGYCDNGQSFTTEFALDGPDGLRLAGRLYGRQQPAQPVNKTGNQIVEIH